MYGGYIATKHLIDHGHKDIITVTSDDKSSKMHEDRTKGYLNAMEEANLKTEVIKSKMDFESQVEFLEKYIDKIKKASAIFVQQDVPAISIIQELKTTYGINVPEDISILISYFRSHLSTIDDPREQVIKNGVDSLVNIINKKSTEHIPRKLYPRLIIRNSVKRIK